MAAALAIFGWTCFGLAIIAGLILDLVGLFGNWIILGAVIVAGLFTGFEHVGLIPIGIMLVLAVAGEALEAGAAGAGAKKFRGGKGSIMAALAGSLLGAIGGTALLPIVGTLAGACFGAFAGAALHEYINLEKSAGESAWTGFGAALGRLAGMFAKMFAGFAMLIVAAVSFIWF